MSIFFSKNSYQTVSGIQSSDKSLAPFESYLPALCSGFGAELLLQILSHPSNFGWYFRLDVNGCADSVSQIVSEIGIKDSTSWVRLEVISW